MDGLLVAIPCVTFYVISVMHAYRLGLRHGRAESTINVGRGGSLTVPENTTVVQLSVYGGTVDFLKAPIKTISFVAPMSNLPEPVDRRPESTPRTE